MFVTQVEALQDVLDRRPRGLKTGDMVEYATGVSVRRYWVMAIQQWMAKGTPTAVGLVWVSYCPGCGERWFQTTETRPQSLAEECSKCDIIGSNGPAIDLRVAKDLTELTDVCLTAAGSVARGGAKRRGRIETHLLDMAAVFEGKSVAAEEFIQRAVDLLPQPDPNKRDTRPQHVRRALQNLSRDADISLVVKDGVVVFTG